MVSRKTSHKGSSKAESQASAMIQAALDPIITIDAKGSIESVNPAFTTMFGYSSDEVIGKNIKMLMPEPFHGEHDGYLSNYKKTGEKKVIGIGREVIAQTKDGRQFPIHLSISEYFVGEQKYFTGTIRDLTQQKENESKVKESETKIKEIISSALDPIITIDAKGSIESVNPAFTTMFGYSSDEVIGKNIKMLMPEPFHGEHDGYLSNYKKTGEKKVIGIGREVIAQTKDGRQFPIHLSISEYFVGEQKYFTGTIRDLTQQKENESKVKESETKIKEIISSALDPIITIDAKGSIESVNPAFTTMFGYSSDEVIGKNIKMLMPEPFHGEHDGYLSNYKKTGEKRIIGIGREVIAQKKYGGQFPIHLSISEYFVGKQKYFTGTVRDLTKVEENKNYLEELVNKANVISAGNYTVTIDPRDEGDKLGIALQRMINILRNVAEVANKIVEGDYSAKVEEQSKGDLLAQAINQMVVKLQAVTAENKSQAWLSQGIAGLNDKTRGITDVSELAKVVCQYLAKYLQVQVLTFYVVMEGKLRLRGSYAFNKRKSMGDTIEFGDGLVGQAALEKEIISITDLPEDYTRINSSIGNAAPRNAVVTPFVVGNTVHGVLELGSFSELSDEKMALLSSLVEPIGVMIQSTLSHIKTKTLLEETQRQSEELKAQQEELQSSNDTLQGQALQLKKSEEELKQQSEELQVTNEELQEKQQTMAKQSKILAASKKDIEIKAQELTLASKYKSEFLANMSHELRTPLNSLLILSKVLADNKEGNLTDKQVEHASVVHNGGKSLLELINDIMDLSKVEAGMLDICEETVKISAFFGKMEALFDPVAKEKDVKFTIEIDEALPESLSSDSQRLEQILKNFLSNAFKFTQKGSVTLSAHKTSKDTQLRSLNLSSESAIALSVTDTGIGIPKDKQREIFEAFRQADGSTSRQYGGTGLGLTISRELASLLGGEIQLNSQEGQGSTFTLYIPLQAPKQSSVQSHNNQLEDSTLYPSIKERPVSNDVIKPSTIENRWLLDDRNHLRKDDKTILIIEDDRDFSKTLSTLIQEMGFKVLLTNLGRDGIYLANEHLPDGILLDMKLPDIYGTHVLEQLKARLITRHIPVHVMSAKEQTIESLRLGATSFLKKPIEKDDISALLHTINESTNGKTKNVLVIEDDKGSQQAIAQVLEGEDINISFAESAKIACEHLDTRSCDCVVLDLGLPDLSGTELVKEISEYTKINNIPIVIYTGREITAEEERLLSQFSSSIVLKGADSPDRLLDDVSLFLHHLDKKYSNEKRKTLQLLHSENEMLKGRRILLVDDDMRNVFALTEVLVSAGLSVNQASNGQEAIDKIKLAVQPFELILMDVMMPVMDGLTATTHIRDMPDYSDIPIIALTAKAMPGDGKTCMDAGVSEYLTKPIDAEKLIAMLRIWLFKRNGTRDDFEQNMIEGNIDGRQINSTQNQADDGAQTGRPGD